MRCGRHRRRLQAFRDALGAQVANGAEHDPPERPIRDAFAVAETSADEGGHLLARVASSSFPRRDLPIPQARRSSSKAGIAAPRSPCPAPRGAARAPLCGRRAVCRAAAGTARRLRRPRGAARPPRGSPCPSAAAARPARRAPRWTRAGTWNLRSGSRRRAPASSLCAVTTASPVANACPSDGSPATTSPVLTPVRIEIVTPKSRSSVAFSSESAGPRSTAARIARRASSSWAVGIPKTAIAASPMNFSTVPPWRSSAPRTASKYRSWMRRWTSRVDALAEQGGVDDVAEDHRHGLSGSHVPECRAESPRLYTVRPMFDTLGDKLNAALGPLRGPRKAGRRGDLARDARGPPRAARSRRQLQGRQGPSLPASRRGRSARTCSSLTPGQQVVKIVHEELTDLMGSGSSKLAIAGKPPTVILLAGLQGSGKTTAAAKLAVLLRKEGHTPALVAADLQRPAAVDQLEQLGRQIQVPVSTGSDPVQAVTQGIQRAKDTGRRRRHPRHGRPAARRRGADGRAGARARRREADQRPPRPRRDDRPGSGLGRRGLPGARRVRRRRPDQARRRCARRRRPVRQGRHRQAGQVRLGRREARPARVRSTPTGWPRASSAWAT